MKKLILFFAILFTVIVNAQTVNLGTPNAAGLPVGIGGTYGFVDVFVLLSPNKLMCNGGYPGFDNNCVSYFQDIDTSTWCKVAKLTGASNVIPFNNPTSNGFGINLFADGKPHQLMFLFYVQTNVWQNTRYANFTAPASSFVAPACPKTPPVVNFSYFQGNVAMNVLPSLYSNVADNRNNCPYSAKIFKGSTQVTQLSVKTLCGATAMLTEEPYQTVIYNLTEGGLYSTEVTNAGGTSTKSQNIPTVPTVAPINSTTGKPGKRKN